MRQLISNKSLLGQWLFEIGAIALASAAVAAMVILLINFDGEPVFDGPMITLNAVISTLSTTSRVCLLAMLASTISQWNWLLFSREPRRLVDFEYFSAASRGPLGSLKVLLDFRILGGPVVRVGALVTILTIALDPFAQQLVQQEKKDDETREYQASIATAKYYSRGVVITPPWSGIKTNEGNYTVEDGRLVPSSDDVLATVEPDSGMDISIKLSYTDVGPGLKHQVAYKCSTADCKYDSFESLAVCSRCDDITASLKKRVVRRKTLQIAELIKDQESPNGINECTEYHLPNGLYLSNLDDDPDIYTAYQPLFMVMFGTGDRNKTMAMTKVNTLIWAQSFISVDKGSVHNGGLFGWPEPKVAAQECALYYCIKEYEAAVKNGTLKENSTTLGDHKRIKDSWQLRPKFNLSQEDFPEYANESLAWDPAVAAFERTNLMLGDTSRNWSIASNSVYSISALMKQTFTKCVETRDDCKEGDNSDPPHGFVARDKSTPAIAESLQFNPGELFKKMASGMSVALRNGADGGQDVTGITLIPVPVYRVAWPWIILHLLATIGSLAFLIATIWSTHKAKLPAWKSSELAVFSQVAAAKGVFSGGETYYELEEKAKAVPVVLLEKRDREEGILLQDRGVSGDVSGEDIMLPTRSVSKTGSLFRRGRNRGEYESLRVDSP
ncbi:hypothetical protein CEP54_007524 [Fusarium duplospermum]|uniref:Uncharacterized protein n=1 Tax=Fusarium duplospermum TaxID=1325734 RepID=A0A428Q1D0_9HYPO|nr:hypothetical protein CEP54_007524 [Fusarium duplospermum]